ncbi:VOC family protein [Cupriavidus sp. L7L]|uniref:VOC family protein n=1 Tax=Cupriavidus sp. L7L TaxID=2546443 RepID=UPI001056B836|nr:VOC family protein [Cupriavidus sp. L7L]TDF64539.1 VOC family protein [Cupriavidus sp. L7L]
MSKDNAQRPHGAAKVHFPADRFPYGSEARFHMHHAHLFASDIDATVAFYQKWFDGKVMWDGSYGGSRNVFMRIGIGALHFYSQGPREHGRNAIHHLGMQVVGLEDLYERMKTDGVELRNPIRKADGSSYLMLEAPDGVLWELFEPGIGRDPTVLRYYGLEALADRADQ